MPSPSDFHLGSPVIAGDQRRVGTLHRVVVDSESYDVQAIVVKEDARFAGHILTAGSLLLSDEIMVPIGSVANVSHEGIDLALSGPEVRRLPPYLGYEPAPAPQTLRGVLRDSLEAGLLLWSSGVRVPRLVAKAAEGLEISRGEKLMMGHSGKALGTVEDVLVEDGDLIGVVVHPVGLFQEDVVMPVRFLSRGDDMSLFTDLDQQELEGLELFRSAGQ